ncbi:uncharacterized protein DNG_01178 [Cephalotrichum gorgonifer]|uniref:MARVEL domain-containing protein n=1 Tax=Cephalotrichum gorgonifer TaxID=2041049 RepID=A0AAE8SRF8_9PEZI|nr:uncharacterized protein DNG_01178 [Cephalotrichum gorgonifer]
MVSLPSIDPDRIPSAKMAVHGLQILLVFVLWCLEISVFVDGEAKVNGRNGWTFGVCFLTIFAWIYNLMTPRWERTRHLADPKAMLVVDAVFTIIWLSAFASQAAYNTANQCGGACSRSKGIVGLGVIVFITWVLAVVISVLTLQHWNINGSLPGYDKQRLSGGSNIDPDKAAFSMAPHDEEAYAPVNMDERDPSANDEYASGAYGGSSSYGGGSSYHGGRYDDDLPDQFGAHAAARPNPLFESDTSYGAGAGRPGQGRASPAADPYAAPSGRNPFDGPEPAQFPVGNYDRVS